MNWIGLDIGGANLKAADGQGWASSLPFPLWREPARLSAALNELLAPAPPAECIAVTMTGELCDCFRTKADGVREILNAVEQGHNFRRVLVYLVDGRLVSPDEARKLPELAAASNWHVLARFAGRYADDDAALLIDVGSTTSDLIPLVRGVPCPRGYSDTDRLLTGELAYSGVARTPICAVTTWLPWQGARCPVAAELFAMTADAYVVLGYLPEQPACNTTADGRPLTKDFARDRLARMICADRTQFTADDARLAAARIKEAQLHHLCHTARLSIANLPSEPTTVVTSGAGEFLAAEAAYAVWRKARIVSVAGEIGCEASQSAPAHALAILARENASDF